MKACKIILKLEKFPISQNILKILVKVPKGNSFKEAKMREYNEEKK